MELQYKHGCAVMIKAVDADSHTAEMIVSVFNNVDSYGDRILPGAFNKSLANKLPKGLWMHDMNMPVAKTLEARELMPNDLMLPDSIKGLGGLYVKGWFNPETQRGREAFSDLKNGIVDEFSIGYFTNLEEMKDGVRELKELTLIEWSPVLLGANPATALISAKNLTFDNHVDAIGVAVDTWHKRLKERHELRLKEGRTFSQTTMSRLQTNIETMQSAIDDVRTMLETAGKAAKSDAADAAKAAQTQLKLKLQQEGIIQ